MKRRLLAGAAVLAIIVGGAVGLTHTWQKPPVAETEAQAIVQIPRAVTASIPYFDRATGERSGWIITKGLADETILRLAERSIPLPSDSTEGSPADWLTARTDVQVESEAGQDRVTITYRTPNAEEAIPILSTLVDTLREVQPASSQQGEAADLAEKESQLTGKLKRLEAAIAAQNASTGLSEAERVVLLEQIKSLGVDLSEARRDRLESEHRLLQTRKDLEAGLPVDVLISRLPGNESQESLRKFLSRPRLQEELQVEQAAFRKLAGVYGKKHPRMIELARKIELLESQSKSLVVQASAETASQSTSDVLLRLLAADLEERQALETDLQEQFDVKKGALDEQAARVATAERMHKEATHLQEEREGARRKIVEIRRRWQDHATEVLVPPGFVELSVDKRFTMKTAGSAIAALGLLAALTTVWWRPSSKSEPSSLSSSRGKPNSFSPLDKFRDKDDRASRLARLKSLGKGRPLAPQAPLLPQNS